MRSSTTVEFVGEASGMGGAVCARSDAKAMSIIAASARESSDERRTARGCISRAIIATVVAGGGKFRWDLAWRLREACCADMSANYANQEIGVPRGTDPWRCLRLGEL